MFICANCSIIQLGYRPSPLIFYFANEIFRTTWLILAQVTLYLASTSCKQCLICKGYNMFLKKTLFLTLKRCWVQSDQHQLNDCWCCGCSVAKSCLTLRFHGQHARHLCHPEFAQTHVRWVSDAIWPFHPLLHLLLLPSVFPSIRVFSNESALCIRWLKYWSFSFSSQS